MRSLSRSITLLILCLVTCASAGCFTVQESPLELHTRQLPQCNRDHVYPIFVASPFDLIHVGGMNQLTDYAAEAGYGNSQLFGFYSDGRCAELADLIREIKQCDPHARFTLVGFSTGCVIIYRALKILCEEGIFVDSVCYLDSSVLCRFCKGPHAENVGCISLIFRENSRLPEGYPRCTLHPIRITNHFGVPTNPQTVHVVLSHLAMHSGMY